MNTLRFTLMSAVLLAASSARAADTASAKTGKVKVSYEKKTTLDFEQKSIDSDFQSPDGASVKGDQNLDFESLLAPRNDFSKELKRGARAVR